MDSLSTQHVCALKHCIEVTQHQDFSLLTSSLLTTEYLLDYCGKQGGRFTLHSAIITHAQQAGE